MHLQQNQGYIFSQNYKLQMSRDKLPITQVSMKEEKENNRIASEEPKNRKTLK